MPASRLASRSADRKRARRWPWVLIGLAALTAGVVFALPASMITHFLPAQVQAEDFSGSLIHGAAGKIRVNFRDAGALEWHLHPLALLRLALVSDIHWVKGSFVVDGTAQIQPHRFAAQDIHGNGPVDSLRDLGVPSAWRGSAAVNFVEISGDFTKLLTAVGKIEVSNLASAEIAQGAELGGYVLELPPGAVNPEGDITANLTDLGGPVDLKAQIRLSPTARAMMLSGLIKDRPEASPALRSQLQSLAQLRPRDSQGRFSVELEFTF